MELCLAGALDALEDAVCVFDCNSQAVQFASAKWRSIAELPACSVEHGHWGSWLAAQHLPQLKELEAAAVSDAKRTMVVCHDLPDGQTTELQITVGRLAPGSSCSMACVKHLSPATARAASPPAPPPPATAAAVPDPQLACAEGLLRFSPQPACIVSHQPTPSPPHPEPGGPDEHGARCKASASAASSGPGGLGSNSSGSGNGGRASASGIGFQWTAYAVLSGARSVERELDDGSFTTGGRPSHALDVVTQGLAAAAAAPGSGSALVGRSRRGEQAAGRQQGVWGLDADGGGGEADADNLGAVLYNNDALVQLCGYSRQQLARGGLAMLLRPPPHPTSPHGGGVAAAAGTCGGRDAHASAAAAQAAALGAADDDGAMRCAGALAAALASGSAANMEVPLYHSTGRRIWCGVSVSPLDNPVAADAADAVAEELNAWRRSAAVPAIAGGCSRGNIRNSEDLSTVGGEVCGIGRVGGRGDVASTAGKARSGEESGTDGGERPTIEGLIVVGVLGEEGRRGDITHTGTGRACAELPPLRAHEHLSSEGPESSLPAAEPSGRIVMQQPQQQQQHQAQCHTGHTDAWTSMALPCEQRQRQQQLQLQQHEQPQQQEQLQRPRRFMVTFHDITAQKQQLQLTAELRQMQRQQMQRLLVGYASTDGTVCETTAATTNNSSISNASSASSHNDMRSHHASFSKGSQQRQALHQQHHQPSQVPQLPPAQQQQQQQQQHRAQSRKRMSIGAAPLPTSAPAAAVSALAAALAAAQAGGGGTPCALRDYALDCVREGITIADPSVQDSPIVFTNQAFLSMTGYSREEVLGRNCRFLQGPDTDPSSVQAIRDAMARREGVTVQIVNYTKAGIRFWNELRLAPVVDPGSGRLVAYIGVQNDVTELLARKQSEARMRDAKEAAESATEAKSAFLANMSHEIRTPLNGMIATAQLLLGSTLNPEQRELAETILESGSTLLSILGDILDFSKIDHGSLELQRRPLCLRQATEAAIDLVAAEAAKKGLAVAYLLEDAALERPLLGDPVRIRQVLANLLSNAVKFTDRGEVVVRVCVQRASDCRNPHAVTAATAAAGTSNGNGNGSSNGSGAAAAATLAAPASGGGVEDGVGGSIDGGSGSSSDGDIDGEGEDGGWVVHIAVADTGIGIGEESARKLFQHFRQGSETMSRRYGGTGLGLAISKRLAQLMRGDIWVDSTLGAGSTFHFTLAAEWAEAGAALGGGGVGRGGAGYVMGDGDGGGWGSPSPSRSAGSTPMDTPSVGGTPRTSTEDAHYTGAAGGGGGAEVALARTSGVSDRTSCSSAGSGRGGRELRTSPWTTDGAPLPEAAVATAAAEASVARRGSAASDATSGGSGVGSGNGSPPQPLGAFLAAAAGVAAAGSSAAGSTCSVAGIGGGATAAEAAEERVALLGRIVLVDITHGATSAQVWNSCRQLGLSAVQAKACAMVPPPLPAPPSTPPQQQPQPAAVAAVAMVQGSWVASSHPLQPVEQAISAPLPPLLSTTASAAIRSSPAASCPQLYLSTPSGPATHTGNGNDDSAGTEPPPPPNGQPAQPQPCASSQPPQPPPYDILVVSMDRLVPAFKAGWKGRPVVVLGDRELLPPALQPLVVAAALPVRHGRLAAALVKATALLRWNGSSAPKLGNAPIPSESIQMLKSWRLKRGSDVDGMNRRTSLDNSALERAVMMRAGGAAGAAGGGGLGGGGKSMLGTRAPPGRQQAPAMIPENSELPTLPDDAASKAPLMPLPPPAPLPSLFASGAAAMPHAYPSQSSHPQLQPTAFASAAPATAFAAAATGTGTATPATATTASTTTAAGAAAAQAAATAAAQAAQLQHLRILIAEDNKVNQKVVLKVLQQILRGCTPPDVVENGLQVLAALQKKTYDLILMDIHMPEMDGLEASKRIQETYSPEERPRIIALSADTVQTLHDRCREAGIEAFLVKPFRIEELARVMHTGSTRLLARKALGTDAPPPVPPPVPPPPPLVA